MKGGRSMKTYTLMEAVPSWVRIGDVEIRRTKIKLIAHIIRRRLQARADRRGLDIVYYVKDY